MSEIVDDTLIATRDRLYMLLPSIVRQRDAEQQYPLKSILRVISDQVNLMDEDIGQVYENWFIETCEDWVVPYIGGLVGYREVHDAGEPGEVDSVEGRRLNRILIPRREVANTIRFRSRKGTLSLLEEISGEVSGWPLFINEFYKLLMWSQHINHQHHRRGLSVDLRDGDGVDLLGLPFDRTARTVDIRRINSCRSKGRFNISSVGAHVYRLRSYPVSSTPAYCIDSQSQLYTFSVLGNNMPLFTRGVPFSGFAATRDEYSFPGPIRRRAFERRVKSADGGTHCEANPDLYGSNASRNPNSLFIWVNEWEGSPGSGEITPVPPDRIIPADLSGWIYKTPLNHVALDPRLGRIVFPALQKPGKVWVSYCYGFSADIGGGEYRRELSQPDGAVIYRVGTDREYLTLNDALMAWRSAGTPVQDAVIEIMESGVFTEKISVELSEDQTLQIRAGQGARPVIRILDFDVNAEDALKVKGTAGGRLTLDGLMITGRGVRVEEVPSAKKAARLSACDHFKVKIHHCTLVPGWDIDEDCVPAYPAKPSLDLENVLGSVEIDHSILGSILVSKGEVTSDPVSLSITDSIVDSTSSTSEAIASPNAGIAHASLSIVRATVLGVIQVHAVTLAENCIFSDCVHVARRQIGCMRFCYVPSGCRTPRRFSCEPDNVLKIIAERFGRNEITAVERDQLQREERLRVKPLMNSARYGRPDYCQLASYCAPEIVRGADDESEMGVFHDLFQPQRGANLRARLDEYLPAGMDAGTINAT